MTNSSSFARPWSTIFQHLRLFNARSKWRRARWKYRNKLSSRLKFQSLEKLIANYGVIEKAGKAAVPDKKSGETSGRWRKRMGQRGWRACNWSYAELDDEVCPRCVDSQVWPITKRAISNGRTSVPRHVAIYDLSPPDAIHRAVDCYSLPRGPCAQWTMRSFMPNYRVVCAASAADRVPL